MAYVESEGFHVRDGRGRSRAGEMLAASYRHTTNRALEPQLHEHVVIANIAAAPNGAIRAVDARGLFAHATPAGYLPAAQLRHDLRQAGVRWGPAHKGLADIEGIDRDQIMAMSSRRQDVLSLSEELGYLTPQARQTAALATRPGKDTSVDRGELFARWQTMLDDLGIDPARVNDLTSHDPTVPLWSQADTEALHRHLSSHRGVTEQTAIFDRRDVIEAVATYAVDRLPAADIVDLADHWLTTDAAIELEIGDGARRETIGTGAAQVSIAPDERRYTTPEMLAIETRVIELHQRGIRTGHALVDPATVEAAIANRPRVSGIELGADQADLVRALTTSGDQFQAAQGLAGAGKTTALSTAIDAWESAGYRVIGTAPFAEAARTLEAETGIESRTLEALLQRVELAADPRRVLDPQTVVIVDEASTIGNRQLHRLYRAATETGASVRTIGDPQQHQSVEAGGLWAHLTTTFTDRTPTLATNRRQTGPDMAEVRLALDDYRDGLIATALDRLDDDNRIIVADTWDDLLDQMTADWYLDHQRHRSGHATGSQMIAERNADRHALNRRAQIWLRQDGTLTHPVRIGDDTFHHGDRVVAQTADKTLTTEPGTPRNHVINGSTGVVKGHTGDPRQPDLIVDFDHLGTIRIPHDFIATEVGPGRGGGITPSYAITSYKAEGQTYDAARSLAAPGAISTEGMYVALTRGRNDLRVYSIAPADQRTEPPELPIIDDQRAATKVLADTLSKWRGADIATAADPNATSAYSQSIKPLAHHRSPGPEDPTAERARRAAEERIAGHAIANADPPVIAHLGPRPDPGDHRTAWEDAVGQLAVYHQRRGIDRSGTALLPAQSPNDTKQHARLSDAVHNAKVRLQESRPIHDLVGEHELLTGALHGSPSISETAKSLLDTATAEHHRNQARLAAAKTDNLASAAARRRDPDAIETSRRRVRTAEVGVARSALRRNDARLLVAATAGDPDARESIQKRANSIGATVDRKIVTAVQNPAPYLHRGARPPAIPQTRRKAEMEQRCLAPRGLPSEDPSTVSNRRASRPDRRRRRYRTPTENRGYGQALARGDQASRASTTRHRTPAPSCPAHLVTDPGSGRDLARFGRRHSSVDSSRLSETTAAISAAISRTP